MSEDIKALLGRAIGDEPPLGFDREDVVEAGRKRLRRRRLIQSSSVVAAVVVAVVGAGTLIAVNPNSAPELPPAATGTAEPSHSSTVDSAPPSTSTTSTTTTRVPVDPADLTAKLYSVLSPDSVKSEDAGLPTFFRKGNRYIFTADVARPNRNGTLTVTVEINQTRDGAMCSDLAAPIEGCTTQVVSGITVAYGDYRYDNGERGVATFAVLPGGVTVETNASNYAGWQRAHDKKPTGDPVFNKEELAEMSVRAGFSAG